MSRDISWPEEYAALIGRLPGIVERSRLIVGGFSTCVDIYLSLREAMGPLSVAARDRSEGASLLAEIERRYIEQALTLSGGVIADAARMLTLQRTTLIEKMRKYEMKAA